MTDIALAPSTFESSYDQMLVVHFVVTGVDKVSARHYDNEQYRIVINSPTEGKDRFVIETPRKDALGTVYFGVLEQWHFPPAAVLAEIFTRLLDSERKRLRCQGTMNVMGGSPHFIPVANPQATKVTTIDLGIIDLDNPPGKLHNAPRFDPPNSFPWLPRQLDDDETKEMSLLAHMLEFNTKNPMATLKEYLDHIDGDEPIDEPSEG